MPQVVECLFCDQRAPRAKEHVFPDWLLRALHVSHEQLNLTHSSSRGEAISKRQHDLHAFRFGHVCKRCNNEWLSRLETEARRVLASLWRGRRRISRMDSWVLTLWSLKTACVLNAASNYRRIVPQDHARSVRAMRPPDGLFVDLSFREIPYQVSWHQSQQVRIHAPIRQARRMEALWHNSGYHIAFGFSNLLLRLVFVPLPSFRVSPAERCSAGSFCRLWPLRPYIVPRRSRPYHDLSDFVGAAELSPGGSLTSA